MPDVLALPVLMAVVLIGLVVVLIRSGALMTADTVTIRRLRRRPDMASAAARAAVDRLGLGEALRRNFALRRLQLAAGWGTDPQRFVERCLRLAVLFVAAPAAVDAVGIIGGQGPAVPLLWVLACGAAAPLAAYRALRREARGRRMEATQGLRKTLLLLGITGLSPVTMAGDVQVGDPLVEAAQALRGTRRRRHCVLRDMLLDGAWRDLAPRPPASRVELVRTMGDTYEVPVLRRIGDVMAVTTERGSGAAGPEYLALARDETAVALADARVRHASRRVTWLIPIAGIIGVVLMLLVSATAYTTTHGGL